MADTASKPLTNRSGTITAGGTSQQIAAANTSRRYLFIRNPTGASEALHVNFGSAAVAGAAYELAAGAELVFKWPEFVPDDSVHVLATTTGHAFIAKESISG